MPHCASANEPGDNLSNPDSEPAFDTRPTSTQPDPTLLTPLTKEKCEKENDVELPACCDEGRNDEKTEKGRGN